MKAWVGRGKHIPTYTDEILELVKPNFPWETDANKQPQAPPQCANDVCYVRKQSTRVTGLHRRGDRGRPLIHEIERYENKCLK